MASTFEKTYSVTVTFRREDGEDISESEFQSTELREEIQKEIAQVCNRQKGNYQSTPGTVSET